MGKYHILDEEPGPEIPSVTSKVACDQKATSSNGQLLLFKKYHVKVGLRLAWTQIAIGTITIVLIIAALLMQRLQDVGISCIGAIFCAIMYIVAGALGVKAFKTFGRRCEVIATMVTSILAAIGAFCGQFLVATLIIINMINGPFEQCNSSVQTPVEIRDICTDVKVTLTLWIILFYLGVLEGVLAIIQSVMCGQSCCYAFMSHIETDLSQSSQPTQANPPTPEPVKIANEDASVFFLKHGLSTRIFGVQVVTDGHI